MSDVHTRAKQGIKLLLGRQVAVQLLTFVGGVVLARILGPAQFGLYIISLFLVNTCALLGDFGLASSFLQRKDELTDRDLQVGFTLQQILTSAVVVVLLIAAPWLVHLYPKAPSETVWLVRVLAFNLYLTSWRTMSALQLERHLRYHQLARVEVVESLSYQTIAVGLALLGGGVWSYILATLVQGVLGTLLVYRAAPWRIQFAFDKTIAKEILRYGVPFQLQTIVNSIGGWITPVIVGSLIGPIGVGYVTWASSNGRKPLILTDIIMRVAFPHFSRIQDDRAEVERILTRYLNLLLLVAGVWFSVLLLAGPSLVETLYTKKWLPAVSIMVVYAAALVFDMASWVVGVALNGLGQVKFTTRIILYRTVGSIILAIPLVLFKGVIGVSLAYLISSAVTIPLIFRGFGKGTLLRITRQAAWIVIPVIVSLGAGWASLQLPVHYQWHACLTTLTVVIFYLLLAYLSGPEWLRTTILIKLKIRKAPAAVLAIGQG